MDTHVMVHTHTETHRHTHTHADTTNYSFIYILGTIPFFMNMPGAHTHTHTHTHTNRNTHTHLENNRALSPTVENKLFRHFSLQICVQSEVPSMYNDANQVGNESDMSVAAGLKVNCVNAQVSIHVRALN